MFITAWLAAARHRRERKRESSNIHFKADHERDKVDACSDVCCNTHTNPFAWSAASGDDESPCVKNNACVKILLMKSHWSKEYQHWFCSATHTHTRTHNFQIASLVCSSHPGESDEITRKVLSWKLPTTFLRTKTSLIVSTRQLSLSAKHLILIASCRPDKMHLVKQLKERNSTRKEASTSYSTNPTFHEIHNGRQSFSITVQGPCSPSKARTARSDKEILPKSRVAWQVLVSSWYGCRNHHCTAGGLSTLSMQSRLTRLTLR